MFLQTIQTENFIPLIILLGIVIVFSTLIYVFKINIKAAFSIQILLGIIIGPWFNQFIASHDMERVVQVLYVIGFVLLMFLSGYDCNYEVIKRKEEIPIVRTVVKMFLLMYLLSFGSSLFFMDYFNNKITGIILMTLVFATTFAGVVIPLVHTMGIAEHCTGKIISTFATIAELASILGLSAFMIVMRGAEGQAWLLIVILIILGLLLINRKYNWVRKVDEAMPGNHFSLKVTLFILLVVVLLSDLSGGEYILGAFLLGMVLKLLRPSDDVILTIENIGYGVFFPMFFVLLGTRIDIVYFVKHQEIWLLTIILTLLIILVKIPAIMLLKWFNVRTIFSVMMIISCTIIVTYAVEHIGLSLHIFDETFAEALKVASIITCIIPPLLFEWLMPRKDDIKHKHIHKGIDCNA